MSASRSKRACDICATLKTQCNLENPCGRCARLNLTCTTERPQKPKGRPLKAHSQGLETKRASTSRQPLRQKSSASGPSVDTPKIEFQSLLESMLGNAKAPSPQISGMLKELEDLPLNHTVVSSLLDHIFSSTQQYGLFGAVIPRNSHLQTRSSEGLSFISAIICSKELLCSLLSVAIRSLKQMLPPERFEEADILHDALKQNALSSIPALVWRSSEQRLSHALSLLILSGSSCFTVPTLEIAERWGSLASLIWRDMSHGSPVDMDVSSELQRRSIAAISVLDRTLSLLHYSRSPTYAIQTSQHQIKSPTLQIPLIDDSLWHSNRYTSGDKFHLQALTTGESYFNLFLPLLSPLDELLINGDGGSATRTKLTAQLEDYFLSFPVSLMNYENIKYIFQVEAMMWMHGIYILLDASLDFPTLLLDRNWPKTPGFIAALEHSLLLGEALPTIIRIKPYLHPTSPATVMFVLLSSIVQSIACSQFNPSHFLDTQHDQPQLPATLKTSVSRHIEFLSQIRVPSSPYNHPMIRIVHTILQHSYDSASRSSTAFSQLSLSPPPTQELKYYRFIPSGTGIVPLGESWADALWNATVEKYQVKPMISDFDSGQNQRERVCHAINVIADPTARICQEGYFDLNIRYL